MPLSNNLPLHSSAVIDTRNNVSMFFGLSGTGKCKKKDTPVMMYNGEIKMVQNIQIGELLMGDDSTPRKVLSTTTGIEAG